MPYFCKDRESRAFERLMQRVPNFERDPPEADVIQRSLRSPHRSHMKEERDPMLFRGSDHQRLFVQEMKRHPDATDQFTAVLYLLTADNELWRQTQNHVSIRDIDLTGLKVHGLTEQSYVFYCAARDMLHGSNIVNVQDMIHPRFSPPSFRWRTSTTQSEGGTTYGQSHSEKARQAWAHHYPR